jgi:hypothetical protein
MKNSSNDMTCHNSMHVKVEGFFVFFFHMESGEMKLAHSIFNIDMFIYDNGFEHLKGLHPK